MKLEAEGIIPISDPDWAQIEEVLSKINPRTHSFVSLTGTDGSYVQTAGARLRLIVEYRDASTAPFRHYVLGDDRQPGALTSVNYSGGAISLYHNEILSLRAALTVFQSFHEKRSIPDSFVLRDDTARHTAA